MTTINVSDEMYAKLMQLKKEIDTQDNRATGKPYFFQIQCNKEVLAREGDGECIYVNDDGDRLDDEEAQKEALSEYYYDYPKELSLVVDMDIKEVETMDEGFSHDYLDKMAKEAAEQIVDNGVDLSEELEKLGYSELWVSTEYEYKNSFFTAKACKEHIKSNHYHYNNPVDYLSHAFRNPDMELMFAFLDELN